VERFVSDNDFRKIIKPSELPVGSILGQKVKELLKIQLVKTDEEWIKWGEEPCLEHPDMREVPWVIIQHRRLCSECWEERKNFLERK
jgi:hypothetical protein